MRKEAKQLLERSINSLILSIEHFNRPWDRGRKEAVLILLDHSFELLLKSSIVHKGEKIRRKGETETIGFEACVNKAISNKIVTEDQAINIRSINGLRDAAQHYIVEVSEQQLYLHVQAGLTLFKDVLKSVFKKDIGKELPERVLPISTTPPLEIDVLFESEIKEIKKLLVPGSRHKKDALPKLRGLSIFDETLKGNYIQPSETHLNNLAEQIKAGKSWNEIFPGVASINLNSDGIGPNLSLRFTKKEGVPIHVVPEGTPGVPIVQKRVNELGYYNLSPSQLSKKLGISIPKMNALIKHLNLREDESCYKLVKFSKASSYHRYSQNAIIKIQDELKSVDIDEIWIKNRPEFYNTLGGKRKK